MNEQEFLKINKDVMRSLKELSDLTINLDSILVLGSVGLISHTQHVGYFRKIKDIDVIVDSKKKEEIERSLIEMGYSKSTFIDKKMPFSKILLRYSESKYTRFHKSNCADLELLFTPFEMFTDWIQIEIFPHVYVSINLNEIMVTSLGEIRIKTLSPEMLLDMNNVTEKFIGKFYKKFEEKRISDKLALSKCVDDDLEESEHMKIHISKLKVPQRLLK